jgi:hypothetical protein
MVLLPDGQPAGLDPSSAVGAVYVRRLAALALDVEAQIAGGCDAAAVRRVRQRLTEWVEVLVRRLSDALAAPMTIAAELAAIADALAKLSTGAQPPDAGPKPSRPPFWK